MPLSAPIPVNLTAVNDPVLVQKDLYVMTVVDTVNQVFTAMKVKDRTTRSFPPGFTLQKILPPADGRKILNFKP